MTATLNGRICSDVALTVPRYGNWRAVIVVQDADALTSTAGASTLTIAGLTLTGTVTEQGERAAQRGAEMVGGFGGWGEAVPPQGHGFAANSIKLLSFADGLARAAGERLEAAAGVDRPMGNIVARLGLQSAGELLSQACASPPGAPVVPWWVDLDGTTHLGARTAPAVDPQIVDAEDLDRWRAYALDDATTLLPGGTIDGRTIEELRVNATGEEVRQIVTLGQPGIVPQTFAAKMRRLVLALLGPHVSASRIYRYSVRSVYSDYRINARPIRSVLAPDLDGLRVWPGIPGGRGVPREGSEIMIQFADGDIGYPVVRGFAPAEGIGLPVRSEIYADEIRLAGTIPVGRVGDLVVRLIFDPATVTLYASPGAAPTLYAPVAGNPQTPNPPLGTDPGTSLTIVQGSAIVGAG